MAERRTEERPQSIEISGEVLERIIENIGRVVHAPQDTLRLAVLSLVSEGHLIIEDFPGVGKTMLAKALARSLDCSFSRIQFTPDLLPSDVTGVNVFDQRTNEFEFRPAPSSRTCSSSTRSTGPRRRPRRRSSSACRRTR